MTGVNQQIKAEGRGCQVRSVRLNLMPSMSNGLLVAKSVKKCGPTEWDHENVGNGYVWVLSDPISPTSDDHTLCRM